MVGSRLGDLADLQEAVELVVIDEVSTCGAASFEVICRRMQQVASVLCHRRFSPPPPDDMAPFGGVGIIIMGDFAQLTPALAASLLPGMPLVEAGGRIARATALAGRQTFATFEDVIRLRRIHRQKDIDMFKESTMRLRDAAITKEDYELWKTREMNTLEEPGPGSASPPIEFELTRNQHGRLEHQGCKAGSGVLIVEEQNRESRKGTRPTRSADPFPGAPHLLSESCILEGVQVDIGWGVPVVAADAAPLCLLRPTKSRGAQLPSLSQYISRGSVPVHPRLD